MGREATEPYAEQRQLLVRRCRWLFSAEERSFRMDRRSRAAAGLRDAVANVLPRFLGSYTDDTLAEYIVILICNGKHQYQARDDLEAFLGDDSAKFVAWLWSYLSKQAVASANNCKFQHGMNNECGNLNEKKDLVAKSHRGDVHIVNSKISVLETYNGLHKLESTTGRNVPQRCISSTVISSPERLGCDQCIWETQHQKNGQNAACSRSFSERTAEILMKGTHAYSEEDADSRTVLVINVHFAATKEALLMHFMKCGTVLMVNILTDAITGHPKGAAYITFADRKSIEKAVSLSGTSFLTRLLTVMPKANAPPGFLASVQHAVSPPQPWKSPLFLKVSTPEQTSGYHLQWKRDQSGLEKSAA